MAKSAGLRTGGRIRARRLDLGIRQSDLAAQAEISPSYLNLIEHDKRRIAGPLLAKMAAALDMDVALLTEGADRAVLAALRQAASDWDGKVEIARVEELAARYPGWARLIAAQAARIAALEARTQLLTDRITHDPDLATALHGMISAVTAIRSTAAILTGDEGIDAEWQRRFHRNIHDDAERLAAGSEALVAYLDPKEDAAGVPLSPIEEVAALLDQTGWHLAALETPGAVPEDCPGRAGMRPAAQGLFDRYCAEYAAAAARLPLGPFLETAARCDYAPDAIAQAMDCRLDTVLRRLASLPPAGPHPRFGLVVCDASGFPIWSKSVAGLAVPRVAACPLWPVFTALGQIGRPVQANVVLPGQPETRLRCTALAQQTGAGLAGQPPQVQATMLMRADVAAGPGPEIALGLSCRICPRSACAARREASALGAQ